MWAGPAGLIACVAAAGVGVDLPAPLTLALAFLCALTVTILALSRQMPRVLNPGLLVSWTMLAVILFGFFSAGSFSASLHGIPLLLAGACILMASRDFRGDSAQTRWKALGMTCALSGGFILAWASYLQNMPLRFHVAAGINFGLLVLCKREFPLRSWAIQTVNTLLLFCLFLPLANVLLCGISSSQAVPDSAEKYYSYEMGTKYPAKFAHWWHYFWTQWRAAAKEIQLRPLPGSGLPFRLKPNARTVFLQSRISINSKGFRGAELLPDSERSYRIVALGESTTFGITYAEKDKPWPELLEQMIKERLKLRRPVEVINAGVASYTIKNNLARLRADILPLKPDMIISYHGINGFNMIESSLAPIVGPSPPAYRARALQLLADAEFQVRMRIYARQRAAQALPARPQLAGDPMDTEYANAYRELIQIAQTNRIRLALANYSMAVNERSQSEVVDFYRRAWPQVSWDIKANLAHSAIVEQLAREHPQICSIDTHPRLDGRHQEFIDLVHFTGDGNRRMAEGIFAGIEEILAKDLSSMPLTKP